MKKFNLRILLLMTMFIVTCFITTAFADKLSYENSPKEILDALYDSIQHDDYENADKFPSFIAKDRNMMKETNNIKRQKQYIKLLKNTKYYKTRNPIYFYNLSISFALDVNDDKTAKEYLKKFIDFSETLITLEPENKKYKKDLAFAYLLQAGYKDADDKIEEALTDSIKAINLLKEINGDKSIIAELYIQSAERRTKLNDYDGAIVDYTKSIEAKPTGKANMGKAMSYIARKRAKTVDMLVLYGEVIKINDDEGLTALAYQLRGITYNSIGETRLALSDLKIAKDKYLKLGLMEKYKETINYINAIHSNKNISNFVYEFE